MEDKTQTTRIGAIISKEFQNSWNILRQAIKNIKDEYWFTVAKDWSFSWTVYHIIETAEFYSRNQPEGMEWGKRAGINWETDSEEEINQKKSNLTKENLLIYLGEVEDRIVNLLNNYTDEELFTTDGFDGGNLVIFEKWIYSLRHIMHHNGELNKVLRDSDCQRIRFL